MCAQPECIPAAGPTLPTHIRQICAVVLLGGARIDAAHTRRYAPEVSGFELVTRSPAVTIAFQAPVVRAERYRRDAHDAVAARQSISVLAVVQKDDAPHS